MDIYEQTWVVKENEFNPNQMRHYETIFTLGNGYLGVRGITEEGYYGRTPGLYLAGLFDQARNEVAELPNLPDWTGVEIELAGERFDLAQGSILNYERTLDLKRGTLTRVVKWASPQGKVTSLKFQRFVSLKDEHLMGLMIQITPENYSGEIKLVSSLNGQVTNSGTQHFTLLEMCTFGTTGVYLLEESSQSGYIIGEAAHHEVEGEVINENFTNGPRKISFHVSFRGKTGKPCQLVKLVSLFCSRDREFIQDTAVAPSERLKEKLLEHNSMSAASQYLEHLQAHSLVWSNLWETADIKITGDDFAQLAIRFAIFHLIQMASWNDARVSIAAKGLSGEGYRGHVFWDTEIFILPFFYYQFPAVARNLLLYRYHTLPGAVGKARENGYEGAMYAWESTDTGEETCPKYGALDLKTRQPIRIWCGELEQHISSDVAFAVWQYYLITGDKDFLIRHGAKIICLTARFWRSRVTLNETDDVFEINHVIGPDEFGEGVNNNYYTNAMAQWHLYKAYEVCCLLQSYGTYDALAAEIGLSENELASWLDAAEKMKLTRAGDDKSLLVQYDNFMDLKEIDVLYYRSLPGTIHEYLCWDDVRNGKVVKQADVILLLYLLGDQFSDREKRANWDYYEPKTTHDSSLSAAIHGVLAAELGLSREAYEFFVKAARIDFANGMGNSDAGLHAGSLGGLWQLVVNGFGGVRMRREVLEINPSLPVTWERLEFHVEYQGSNFTIVINKESIEIECRDGMPGPIGVRVWGEDVVFDEDHKKHVVFNRVKELVL